MALSVPSFFAAATSASMPPPAVAEVAFDQSVVLAPPEEDEVEELPQAVAASAMPAAMDASLVTRFMSGSLFSRLSRVRGHTWSGTLEVVLDEQRGAVTGRIESGHRTAPEASRV